MTTASTVQEPQPRSKPQLNFSDGNREAHLQAFFAWLPELLHQAPGINWSALSSKIIGYCILTIADSPDKMCIVLAMGTAIGAVDQSTLHSYTYRLNVLLRLLRSRCGLQEYEQLTRKAFWEEFIKRTEMTLSRVDQLKTYMAFVEKYEREYLAQLAPGTRDIFQPYLLPSLPAWFIKRYSGERQLRAASRQRRKEQSDVLVPLYHVLVALVQMRKQAAERMLHAFREARKRAEAGEELPLRFTYEEYLPEVNRAARTVEEVQIEGRPVTMQFTLWDKRSWVLAHPDRYEPSSIKKADRRKEYFKQENELFFLLNAIAHGDHNVLFNQDIHARAPVCKSFYFVIDVYSCLDKRNRIRVKITSRDRIVRVSWSSLMRGECAIW